MYGTVLPWLGSTWRGVPAADGEAFGAALAAQSSDWSRLRAAYPGHDFVLAGDFNQDLAPSHYYGSRRNRERLVRALDAAGLVALTAGDDDPVYRASCAHACIDHICLSAQGHWRVEGLSRWPATIDGRLSDHFGIAVELTLSSP